MSKHFAFCLLAALTFLPEVVSSTDVQVGPGGFSNIVAARDHVRTLAKDEPVIVEIAAGIYPIADILSLSREDSGTEKNPIIYRAAPGAKVIFDGSIVIPTDGFATAKPDRLATNARGKVVTIPIKDEGLAKFLDDNSPVGRLMMQGDDLLAASRFPNVGFAHAAEELIFEDEPTRWQKTPVIGTREKPNGAIFTLREEPAGTWEQWAEEVNTRQRAIGTGYLSAQWYRETREINAIDPEKKSIQYVTQTRYGLGEMAREFQSRVCVRHLLCEIDSPGEWYFDAVEENLYLWPTQPLGDGSRLVVAAGKPFLSIRGASHVRFENLIIQGVATGGSVIEIRSGEGNRISGCTIRNSPVTAISVEGKNNTVHGCDVYDVTRFARLSGGRATPDEITPGGNTISNCHFYLDKLTGVAPGVGISGVGNHFRNNLMHNLPGQAIVFSGNDHRIERNELFNIGFEEGDGAAIYSGAQFWGYGVQIKHNFLHHIMSTDGLMTRSGIMLDDHDSGREVIENIFYKTGHGSLAINGGTGLKIHRNVFMSGDYGVWVRIIGNVKERMEMQAKFDSGELKRGDKHDYVWRCEQVVGENGWNDEPWMSRYPMFPKVMAQTGKYGRFWPIENDVDGNMGADMGEGITYRHPGIPKDRLVFKNTKLIDPEKLFVAPGALDFRWKIEREDWMPEIPFKEIGLYLDSARRSMPDKADYRKAVRENFKDRRSCNRWAKYDFENVNQTIYWNSGALLKKL